MLEVVHRALAWYRLVVDAAVHPDRVMWTADRRGDGVSHRPGDVVVRQRLASRTVVAGGRPACGDVLDDAQDPGGVRHLVGGSLHGCCSAADAWRDDLGCWAAAAGVVATAARGIPGHPADNQGGDGPDRPGSDQVASSFGALLLSAQGRDPLAAGWLLAFFRVWHRTPGVCSSLVVLSCPRFADHLGYLLLGWDADEKNRSAAAQEIAVEKRQAECGPGTAVVLGLASLPEDGRAEQVTTHRSGVGCLGGRGRGHERQDAGLGRADDAIEIKRQGPGASWRAQQPPPARCQHVRLRNA